MQETEDPERMSIEELFFHFWSCCVWAYCSNFLRIGDLIDFIMQAPYIEQKQIVLECYPQSSLYLDSAGIQKVLDINAYYSANAGKKHHPLPEPEDRALVFALFVCAQGQLWFLQNWKALASYYFFFR